MQNLNYKVLVRCFTFNQSRFILDALDGFAMQQTKFPFIVALVDDASTDGEQEVILKYLADHFEIAYTKETDYAMIHFAQHNKNSNCFIAFISLKMNHYQSEALKNKRLDYIKEWSDNAEYISYCEGDDYWISQDKLQKQVEILDEHKDCMACFHNAIMKWDAHEHPDKVMCDFKTGFFSTAQIFGAWQLPLASLVYRKEIENKEEYLKLIKNFRGGFSLFIAASLLGKVYGINECMSVYRRNSGGISNRMSRSYCIFLNISYAVASEDKEAIDVIIRKSKIAHIILPYLKREEYSVKVMELLKKHKPSAIVNAYFKLVFFLIPKYLIKNVWKKIKSLFFH